MSTVRATGKNMNIIDIIAQKRDGNALSTEQINWFIEQYTNGSITDYQASALLMAIYIRGMSRNEIIDLTQAMADSGDQLSLHDVADYIVDKHSSGGVGDKTSLVVLPLVAACGVPVGKMSGRGLGSSGGTLDKMESISGWSGELSLQQFRTQLREIGIVLASQSADFAPADGKLYALRDVTATVSSIPLIAASIMSKKLAAGADGIVLDVKVGSGAFMKTLEEARELAEIMVTLGKDAGREAIAILSDMNQPLGHAVGNALEVREAIATLRDHEPPADFWEHCLLIAAHMLYLAGKADTLDNCRDLVRSARDKGKAFSKFRAMVEAQGGDIAQVDHPERLPQAVMEEPVYAPRSGYVAAIDTEAIGWAGVHLGAGRLTKSDRIDHAVGLVMPAKIGMQFAEGDVICTIFANDTEKLDKAHGAVLGAVSWSDTPVTALPNNYGTVP
ncbi:MAG: thymidine phosphorylase [Anaerolineae bacterium]|nr:thymidine phosphorylase [Anaerolineae bacterium]